MKKHRPRPAARRKPLRGTECGTPSRPRFERANALRKLRQSIADHLFALAIRKEREIGMHPKFLHSFARSRAVPPKVWEAASKAWDKKNLARKVG